MHVACEKDDVATLHGLVSTPRFEEFALARDAHGHGAAQICASHDSHQCLQMLLDMLGPPLLEAIYRLEKTPLHQAAFFNASNCVRLLLQHGADPDARCENRKFKSALCKRFEKGHCAFGAHCHFAHGDAELRRPGENTPRRYTTPFESAIKGEMQCIKRGQPDDFSQTFYLLFETSKAMPRVLHRVCKSADALKIVVRFAIRCEHKGLVDWWRWTLLHHCAHLGDCESCVALLAWDRSLLDAQDSQGKTPLHRAAQWAQKDTVRVLVEHGADPTMRNSFGVTAVEDAFRVDVRDSHGACIDLLMADDAVIIDLITNSRPCNDSQRDALQQLLGRAGEARLLRINEQIEAGGGADEAGALALEPFELVAALTLDDEEGSAEQPHEADSRWFGGR